MALLFIDSFDHYADANVFEKWTGGGSGDIGIGHGRCGSNCLNMDRAHSCYRGIDFAGDTAIIGFAFYLQEEGTDPGRDFGFLTLNNASGTGWLGSMTYFSDGSLAIYSGNGSVLIGQTPPNTIHLDTWYFIEWKATFSNTVGAMTLRVNNVPLIAVTGVDTIPDYPGNLPPVRQVSFISGAFVGGQFYRIDDFYALNPVGPAPWNDFLGDCRVEYLRPRAAGSLQQWTPVGTTSHWLAVDDNATPDSDTTYVEATAPGLTDTNLYQPTGLPSGPIYGAQLSLYARKTEIGPRVIQPVVGTTPSGPTYGPSFETYQYYCTPYATNPATGLAWTIAEINAAQFGVTVVT